MWVARGPFSLSAGTLRPRFLAGTASARLVGILFCAGLCAAGSRPAGGQGVFRAAADHVTLDVVVTDANNRPVSGLVKDDFTVLERGRRQAISELTFVSIPVENRVIDLEASPQVESDIASNAEESSRSRAIAIVIDDTILSPTDIVPTKRLLAALLGAVSNDDQVAISYVRRSDLGQSFTNQPAKLIRAVNHLKASVGLPGVAGGAMEARDFLTVLDNVAGVLRTAPQARRFIVLVSFRGCVPNPIPILSKTSPSVSAICKGVIDKAKQAGVPIYAVDPTGNLEDSVPGGFHDSLATLAVATGGRAFRFSQPTKSAAALMADNGSYYVIGYHSTLRRTDGRFQPVEVSVHKPGIIVRARSGYFAPSGQLAPTPQRAMAASLAHGVPSPALPLRVHLLPLRASAGGKTSVVVTMEVAYPLPESLGAGEFADEWRVGILASDPDGNVKASFQRPLTFSGTWKKSARGTFIVNEQIDVSPGLRVFRVGITSHALQRTGTVHSTLDVPNFAARTLTVCPIVLGTSLDDLDAAIGLERIRPLLPFQPTTARTFKADQMVRVFSKAFWSGHQPSIVATWAILRAGETSRHWSASLPSTRLAQGPSEASFDRVLNLAGLAEGPYILQVRWTLSPDDVSTQSIPLEIR